MPISRLLSTRLRLLATLWLVAEGLVFVAAAHVIGLGWTLLAGLATTLLGGSLLKRIGTATMVRLRGALQGRHDGSALDALDGTLAAVSAAALILPGFLSDAAGLALAIPAVRNRTARWVRGGGLGVRFAAAGGRSAPRTIDLDQSEWSRARAGDESGKRLR